IIAFAVYWLCRTVYLSFHLRSGYKKMQEYQNVDWLAKLKQTQNWERIYHLVIIPTYRESADILRQTILSLVHSDYPRQKMIVVLGIEQSLGKEADQKAALLEQEFGNSFFRFLVTRHPQNLLGEIPGKGSNESFAARLAHETIVQKQSIKDENVIVTSLDADTVVYPRYFSCLAYKYCTVEDPTHASFQPVPLFLNNVWQAPAFSQIFSFSSTFWHTMNQERPEKLITFSSHSMSLKALVDVGFKQTNVVSDDSRIFWQCFLKYDGNYRVEPLYYPVSMDATLAATFWQTLKHMYYQQKRWAYGVADIPYFLFGFLKNPRIRLSRRFSLGMELIEGHWSWATSSIILFSFGWLPVVLGRGDFSNTLLSYNLPRLTSSMLTLAMLGLLGSVMISIKLLPPRPPGYPKWKMVLFVGQWLLFPFTMIFFTGLPALEAQTRLLLGKYMGFWSTPKFRAKSKDLVTQGEALS
ncbi:MAG: glycosyltransferase family 2 protein, partial [Candidatus Wildermuthbacteria bacterium]|nr:glycosyltransferase family 2 protein [Candidatus Wildermuthbacteria bacterium]